eukprot:scaffold118039_cov21-Tisochrysis_lutea.AAC.1
MQPMTLTLLPSCMLFALHLGGDEVKRAERLLAEQLLKPMRLIILTILAFLLQFATLHAGGNEVDCVERC